MNRPRIVRRRWQATALAVMLLCCASADAQVLDDPTRPPGLGVEGRPAGEPASTGGPTLQSVMISPTQRAAIISGVMVKEGEKYGDAVLSRVAENEVVLKSAGVSQVLKLYPGVEKREAAPQADKGVRQRKPASAAGTPPRPGRETR